MKKTTKIVIIATLALAVLAFFAYTSQASAAETCYRGVKIYMDYNSNLGKSIWTQGVGSSSGSSLQGFDSLGETQGYIDYLYNLGYTYSQCSSGSNIQPQQPQNQPQNYNSTCYKGAYIYYGFNSSVNKSVWTKGIGSSDVNSLQGYENDASAKDYIDYLYNLGYSYSQCAGGFPSPTTPTPSQQPQTQPQSQSESVLSTTCYNRVIIYFGYNPVVNGRIWTKGIGSNDPNSIQTYHDSEAEAKDYINYLYNLGYRYAQCGSEPTPQPQPQPQPQPVPAPAVYKPLVETLPTPDNGVNGANLKGTLLSLGGADYANVWFELYDNGQWVKIFNIAYAYQTVGNQTLYQTGAFNYFAPSATFARGNKYCYRAVAQNSAGTSFGNEQCFIVPKADPTPTPQPSVYLPVITTLDANNITRTSATMNCALENLGNDNFSSVWAEYKTDGFGQDISFSQTKYAPANVAISVENLFSNRTYYFRCVAKNSAGSSYGQWKSFTTQGYVENNERPAISTLNARNVSTRCATFYGNLENLGKYGSSNYPENYVWFEYGRNSGYGEKTSESSRASTGEFNSREICSLNEDTTYHFRACARNMAGTTCGNDVSFTTNRVYTDRVEDHSDLNLRIWVRNLSRGETYWSKSTNAKPYETLEFKVEVRNDGNVGENYVLVSNILPYQIKYSGKTVVNDQEGEYYSVNSIKINSVPAGINRYITFQAKVLSPNYFNYGANELTVYTNLDNGKSDTTKVYVYREDVAGATTVKTGLGSNIQDYILLPIFLALAALFIFRRHLAALFQRWDISVLNARESSAKMELQKKINRVLYK